LLIRGGGLKDKEWLLRLNNLSACPNRGCFQNRERDNYAIRA
jgi:hypothetical protein